MGPIGSKIDPSVSGPIHVGDEGAEGLTNNVAELMAIIHALRWAQKQPNPILMRYDSKYAALVTVGVYKAKKNRKLVQQAQTEWKRLAKIKRGKLWLRHVKGHSRHRWNDRADKLAELGRMGEHRCGPPHVD